MMSKAKDVTPKKSKKVASSDSFVKAPPKPVANMDNFYESSMEASAVAQRANRRSTRRGAALQQPRRKPNYAAPILPPVEEEASGRAQSAAKRSDSAGPRAESDTQGFEKPMKFGSID